MKFEIYQDKAGEWRFRLKARNGKIMAVGEGYKRKGSVVKAVKRIIIGVKSIKYITKRGNNENITRRS